ncbi:uncharacterized protein LOC119780630 isoform X3 [Cyprinodon tularosa]|uniref:uncharacterized protein LOC119780630 isoform X3 n=1 Tax=Cyprinodon tularosa TaxID=77115 RepID=UPI0018E25E53|nr:uncharacterized protein LOC119780630 isoform X3 [Cyprinodon tularosa]
MELNFLKHLNDNTAEFKRTLDRIVDKYSKLNDEDEAIDVDISKITTKTLVSYVGRSNKFLKSKTQPDLEDQSLNSDTSSNSELHFPHDDDESENQSVYSTELPEDNGADKAMRLLDESCWNWSENEPQPPDQDGDVSSQSYSLAELYPTMVSRIRRAWHRQAVSVAAGSVVRRYRRWRQRPKGILNSTFDLTARPAYDGTKVSSSKRLVREGSGSLSKSMGIETMPHPILSTVTTLSPRRQFPGRKRRLSIGETLHPCSVMSMSDKANPTQVSLNETFFVLEQSPPCKKSHFEEQIPINAATPSKCHCSDAESSMDQFFKRKGLSGSSQSAYVSTYVAEAPSVPYIYSSQDRQSPFKASRMGTLSRSPHAFSRSPNGYGSTEPMTSRSPAILMPSPPKRSAGLHYPHDSSQSPKSLPHSHLSAQRAESHRGFRQHLSFDSSLSRPFSMSPKQVDEDFKKLYHKFVCCNESNAFNAPPCRLCGRSSEARRVLSPLSLATPALSPHRSNLSKWYMEESEESHPQSKRLREDTFTYSPGSKKQSNETLRRRRLSRSEAGPSFCTAPNSVSETQQPAENVEEWLIKHQPFFAAKAYR